MATQTLTFTAPPGLTLGANLYTLAGVIVGTETACTESARGSVYSFDRTNLSGQYEAHILKAGVTIAVLFTPVISDVAATHRLEESIPATQVGPLVTTINDRVPSPISTLLANHSATIPTQALPAVGTALSRDQSLVLMAQRALNSNVTGTTETVYQADGVTPLYTSTLTVSGDDVTAVARAT